METINEFIKDNYPTLSVIALFIIIALLACSLFCKKKDFNIGVKKEFVIWGTLVCSLIALCRTFPTSPCFDYMGIIVGVLSLLITVLMGWNIFSVIDVKNIRQDYEKLKVEMKSSIKEQEQEKERLRNYVNIVQNFTMGNVRLTEKKYGDALGIYCNAAISLYEIVKRDDNKTDDEQDLMDKSIRKAYNIVNEDKIIRGSQLLTDMHNDILKGLKEIKFKDVRTQEILSVQIQAIMKVIEDNYINDSKKDITSKTE